MEGLRLGPNLSALVYLGMLLRTVGAMLRRMVAILGMLTAHTIPLLTTMDLGDSSMDLEESQEEVEE